MFFLHVFWFIGAVLLNYLTNSKYECKIQMVKYCPRNYSSRSENCTMSRCDVTSRARLAFCINVTRTRFIGLLATLEEFLGLL